MWKLCYHAILLLLSLPSSRQQAHLSGARHALGRKSSEDAFAGSALQLSQAGHLGLIRRSIALFENKTLTVCVVVREPFVIFDEPAGWSNMTRPQQEQHMADLERYSGVAVEVVKRLSSIFKFRVRITRPRDNQFGVQLDSGHWTGLMGMLHRKEADIGLTALSITSARAQTIEFTRAYYVETVAILLKTPEEVQNYLAIFEPFTPTVWLVLLATILLLILMITIMTKLEDDQLDQERRHKLAKFLRSHSMDRGSAEWTNEHGQASGGGAGASSEQTRQHSRQQPNYSLELNRKLSALAHAEASHEFGSSWLERFYYAVTCVLNILLIRDIKQPPHQTPIRILVCFWWLSTIVIVNIYLGILFGQLVVPRRPKSIETLEELVNQDQIAWCVTRGSAIHALFESSEEGSVYGKVGRRMHNVSSADEGVRRVLDSNWAFIRERSILTFKVAHEHNRLRECKMQFGREDFYSVGFGIGLVRRSAYLEPFNSALTLLIENGSVARWQAMYWPRRNQFTECKLQPGEGEPLSIKHFLSIYLVCAIITATSMIILIYQYLFELMRAVKQPLPSRPDLA